ncbi:MAG: site-specific DNA-methyltransferase [Acidobacteria bacterium]|nr:MAG: site-specific DNA-methyltransferase [Acidobacteriota bacterium]
MKDEVNNPAKEKSRLTKDEWREYTKTVWSVPNTTDDRHPAVFPLEIPHRLVKLFTFYGDLVLDPFAGIGTTAKASLLLGRRAFCVEQNPEYAQIITSECASVSANAPSDSLTVVIGDARVGLVSLASDSVGLVVTSPPYWNKASYGRGPENLGNIENYCLFFREITPVFQQCLRVLSPGRKLCIVTANVNQFTDHGLLTFPLAADFIVLLRNLGFVLVSELVWNKDGTGGKWGSHGAQRPIFGSYPYPPNFLFKNVHEYILIFAKPESRRKRGPKVRKYGELGWPDRA